MDALPYFFLFLFLFLIRSRRRYDYFFHLCPVSVHIDVWFVVFASYCCLLNMKSAITLVSRTITLTITIIFIIYEGTPLSTFTGYISRLRGYMDKSHTGTGTSTSTGLYKKTYYFMRKQMYQLRDRPHLELPFWPREFVEAFEGTDL